MIEPSSPSHHVEIFCSYAHEDEALRQEFFSSVALLRQQKLVEVWHDREIRAGTNWAGEIDHHLNSADIVVLLISRDFLNSDFCYAKELARALEREANKEAVVVPIIARACDWEDAPFGRLQGVPTDAKPVTSWENRDEAWTSVAKSLKVIVREVLEKKLAQIKASANEQEEQKVLQDQNQARQIYMQIMADRTRFADEMAQWQIMQDIQTKIFTITEDLSSDHPRPKTSDKSFNNMDAYIRG